MDRENQLCIQMLADLEDNKMRPEYILLEQQQCAKSLYCFQACEHALKNIGKKIKPGEKSSMYEHEVSYRTQYDFNHTTFIPFSKQSHLYEINKPDGWEPKWPLKIYNLPTSLFFSKVK